MKTLLSHIKSWFSAPRIRSLEGLEGWNKVDALLYNLAGSDGVPGMAVSISKNGKTMLQKGYGYADLEQKTEVEPENTLFRIASISKCITGIALAKMVEEGLLSLDDSLYKHVPYYPQKDFDFTLRQLAGHTAGIRGYRGKEFALNRNLSIKDSLEVFQKDPQQFEPGKGYLYNSFDYVLLSLAMQEACGKPFEDYVREKVLEPLHMNRTFSPAQVLQNPELLKQKGLKLANFYSKTKVHFKSAIPVNNQYKLAGGGYLSTSQDVIKLGQALLEGNFVKRHLLEEVLRAQTVNGSSTYYGLGFQVSQDHKGRNFIGHVGNSVGAYSNFFVFPEQETVISILINCTDPKIQSSLDEIVDCALSEK